MRRSPADQKARALEEKRKTIESVRKDFFGLFALDDAVKRGKASESVLNRLFAAHGMLVREPFTVKGHCGEGIVEQIDRVVEIDSYLYLVEMKWWNKPIAGEAIVVLCKLQELVDILIKYEDGVKLEDVLKNKTNAAILDRQPFQEFKN